MPAKVHILTRSSGGVGTGYGGPEPGVVFGAGILEVGLVMAMGELASVMGRQAGTENVAFYR